MSGAWGTWNTWIAYHVRPESIKNGKRGETSQEKSFVDMMLTSSKVMGTVVGSHWQMQAIKDGKMTCVLKMGYTPVKKWIRFLAMHAGVNARNAGWNEELVGMLLKDPRSGGCVLGPFSSAEMLWHASQGGARFKVGMSLKEVKLWMRWMARLGKGDRVYVYRFQPAKVNVDLVWNDGYYVGDDWASGFVRSRNHRGRRTVRFYIERLTVTRKNKASDYCVWIESCMTMMHDLCYFLQGQRPEGKGWIAPSPSPAEAVTVPLVREDESAPYQPPNAEMPQAFLRVPGNSATAEMAVRTQEVAREFREAGVRNGMDVLVLIALEKLEEALAFVGQMLEIGSLHGLTVALFDLRMAIDEYGWAIHQCGWDAGYQDRVRALSRVVSGIEHNMEYSLHLMALNMGRM